MLLDRSVRWRGQAPETLEHAHILANGQDIRVRGAIVGPDFGLFYRLKCDGNGQVRTVKIERSDGGTLELYSDGAGAWSDDRAEPIKALHGCIDVDLWPSPLTAALPVWRSDWVDGQPVRFAMARIEATTLTFKRVEQVYTRLDASHFRFQSADFEIVLRVDDDGLALDYPGFFTQAPPAGG